MGKLFDNHNHSQFSFDGKNTSVEKSSLSAVQAGLSGLCFTDHCDFYVPPVKAEHENLVPEEFDVSAQQQEIDRVRERIPEISIFKGIEIGLQKSCRKQIRHHIDNNSFDQVIASVHYIDQTDPFYGGYYEDKDWEQAYGHYLETIAEETRWLENFDILGHYDYVTRYAPYPKASMLYRDFPDLFDSILKFLAENGKALEINTKTYQDYNGRRPELDKDVLIRYRELGGELLSFGSDSHTPDRVGENFRYFEQYILSCGFKYTAHFEKRKPVMERI